MRPGLILSSALPLALAACSGDSGSSTGGETTASTTAATATDSTDSTTASTTDASSTATTTATTTSTTAESTTSTTGVELCNFGTTGDSMGSEQPWIELYNKGVRLADAGVLNLECGFQGSFMFEVVPYFGSFTPADEYVYFNLWLDVDGHNENPDGHFYSNSSAPILVGCGEETGYDGGFANTFQMLLFDLVTDLAALDGLPAHLHVDFVGDGVPVVVDLDLTLSVTPTDEWQFCGYVDTDTDTGTDTDSTSGTGP
ncbi:MAG: hypothetical protein R3B09_05620 [Nannocystaceae bacterium]